MESPFSADIEDLRAALAAAEARAMAAEAKVKRAAAQASHAEAIIAALKLQIAKLRREIYGQRSERKTRLLGQLELELEEWESQSSADELAAEQAASCEVKNFGRKAPSRKPFPAHLPRERVVIKGPTACACCGSDRLR